MRTKSVRNALYDVRDWSSKILASPKRIELEWSAKLAEALQILILPEHQTETMDFWRSVCDVSGRMRDEDIIGRAKNLRSNFIVNAKTAPTDDDSRKQLVKFCRRLVIIYDRSFRTIGRTKSPEPLFATYLGRPKEHFGLRVYEGGKTA